MGEACPPMLEARAMAICSREEGKGTSGSVRRVEKEGEKTNDEASSEVGTRRKLVRYRLQERT